MKTKTENILQVMKIFALLGGIGYSIECGSQILSLVAGFITPDWAKRGYNVDQDLFSLREHNTSLFIYAMSFIIALSAIKAFVWYLIADMLFKLKLKTPFSMQVEKKLETIAYQLFTIWVITSIARSYMKWLSKKTGIEMSVINTGDEYIFVAGIVYIVSQIFKRGIEIQEENQLTV